MMPIPVGNRVFSWRLWNSRREDRPESSPATFNLPAKSCCNGQKLAWCRECLLFPKADVRAPDKVLILGSAFGQKRSLNRLQKHEVVNHDITATCARYDNCAD